MDRNTACRPSGFSLLEMMLVVAVIGILMGMLGAAAYSARQRTYVTLAQAEAQQIATAFKSYWLAKDKWPEGFSSAWTELNRGNLAVLMGGDEEDGIVYLNIPPDRFERTNPDSDSPKDPFLDPWGHPYEVSIESIESTIVSDTLEGAVTFPNLMRHYYEDGVYTRPAGDWDWDAYN